jgi:small subunit ribosomal protein S11
MAKTAGKKRKVIVESIGEAHVTASFNNIIISLTNTKGEVISWSSAGKMGFRGSKKKHPLCSSNCCGRLCKNCSRSWFT